MLKNTNNTINNVYWAMWQKFDLSREEGVEAIEWIAMAACVLLLLTAVGGGLSNNGESLGNTIVSTITAIVEKVFKF